VLWNHSYLWGFVLLSVYGTARVQEQWISCWQNNACLYEGRRMQKQLKWKAKILRRRITVLLQRSIVNACEWKKIECLIHRDHNYGAHRAQGYQRVIIGTLKGDRVDHNQTTPSKEDRIWYLMWVTTGGWVAIGGYWKLEEVKNFPGVPCPTISQSAVRAVL